jgi:hypothetical protein
LRTLIATAALLVLIPTLAGAQTMSVAEFLARADGLQKKGPMALVSSDLGALKSQITGSGAALRAQEAAARQAGRRPETCLPPKAQLSSSEILAHFRSIPAEQRGMPVVEAFRTLVQRKYPCSA